MLEIRNKHENKLKDREHYRQLTILNINTKDCIKQKNPEPVTTSDLKIVIVRELI